MVEKNKIYHGNNLEILKTFEDNSIDSIVTDPPYGLGKEPDALEVLQSWITTGYHEVNGKGFMGKEWDAFVPQPIFWKECLRVLKHGGHLLSFAGTRTYDWVVMGLRIAGFEIRDQIAWVYGSGFPKSLDVEKAVMSKLGYEIPKDLEHMIKGWGTALKPALEPIVMARKPLDGTVAQNVLKYGVGGINIDGCRVELNGEEQPTGSGGAVRNSSTEHKWGYVGNGGNKTHELGRFPANFIHDGSDEVVKLFPSAGSGNGTPYNYSGKEYNNKDTSMFNGDKPQAPSNYNDSGSAARFFYTAKASQKERNWGLDGFEEVSGGSYEFRQDGSLDGKIPKRKNIHPTVKPIDLMRYLVRLVTPKGGVCLDPFMGSGTTAVACKMEGFNYIGCELEEEYVKIAEARIEGVIAYDPNIDTKVAIQESQREKKEQELGIMNIFDFLGEEK